MWTNIWGRLLSQKVGEREANREHLFTIMLFGYSDMPLKDAHSTGQWGINDIQSWREGGGWADATLGNAIRQGINNKQKFNYTMNTDQS